MSFACLAEVLWIPGALGDIRVNKKNKTCAMVLGILSLQAESRY